jgi:peptidyl-prolyl cis-trans isomerase A (cyclophilin A)
MLMLSLMALSLAGAQPAAVSPVADGAQAPAETVAPVPDKRVYVELLTDAGRMVVRLETERAPITTGNFLRYVDSQRMNGFQFYRATRNWGVHSQIIQAGNRGDARQNFPAIAHEPTSQTGLTHCKGALSMARLNPGDATTDFFLLLSAIPGFDADPSRSGDSAGFAVFGELVEGGDVAQSIFDAPISPTDGQGVMLGQMLEKKVTIRTAKRIAAPAIVPQTCVVKSAAPVAEPTKGEAE